MYVLKVKGFVDVLYHEASEIRILACDIGESRQRIPMIDKDSSNGFAITLGDGPIVAMLVALEGPIKVIPTTEHDSFRFGTLGFDVAALRFGDWVLSD